MLVFRTQMHIVLMQKTSFSNKKTPQLSGAPILIGGDGGIRTPGTSRYNGFQDRRIRPLCHISATKVT
jgi:hypothetical protein